MLIKEETLSTNTDLRSWASQYGHIHFLGLLAGYQTQGRGQFGRTWASQKGKNLLFSVLFRPKERGFSFPQDGFLLVAKSLEIVIGQLEGLLPQQSIHIKWPNDLYVGRKKIGGILLESFWDRHTSTEYAILGMGININQIDFQDLTNATSLKLLTEREHHIFTLARSIEEAIASELCFSEGVSEAYMQRLLFTQEPSAVYIGQTYYSQALIREVKRDGSLVLCIIEPNKQTEMLIQHHQHIHWVLSPL